MKNTTKTSSFKGARLLRASAIASVACAAVPLSASAQQARRVTAAPRLGQAVSPAPPTGAALEARVVALQTELRKEQAALQKASKVLLQLAPEADQTVAQSYLDAAQNRVNAVEREMRPLAQRFIIEQVRAELQKPVSLTLKDATLQQMALALEPVSRVQVQIDPALSNTLRVTLDARRVPLADVLEAVARRTEVLIASEPDGFVTGQLIVSLVPPPALTINGQSAPRPQTPQDTLSYPWTGEWYGQPPSGAAAAPPTLSMTGAAYRTYIAARTLALPPAGAASVYGAAARVEPAKSVNQDGFVSFTADSAAQTGDTVKFTGNVNLTAPVTADSGAIRGPIVTTPFGSLTGGFAQIITQGQPLHVEQTRNADGTVTILVRPSTSVADRTQIARLEAQRDMLKMKVDGRTSDAAGAQKEREKLAELERQIAVLKARQTPQSTAESLLFTYGKDRKNGGSLFGNAPNAVGDHWGTDSAVGQTSGTRVRVKNDELTVTRAGVNDKNEAGEFVTVYTIGKKDGALTKKSGPTFYKGRAPVASVPFRALEGRTFVAPPPALSLRPWTQFSPPPAARSPFNYYTPRSRGFVNPYLPAVPAAPATPYRYYIPAPAAPPQGNNQAPDFGGSAPSYGWNGLNQQWLPTPRFLLLGAK